MGLRKAKRHGGFREGREIRTIKRPRTTLIPDLVMVLKVLMVLTVLKNKTIKTAANEG